MEIHLTLEMGGSKPPEDIIKYFVCMGYYKFFVCLDILLLIFVAYSVQQHYWTDAVHYTIDDVLKITDMDNPNALLILLVAPIVLVVGTPLLITYSILQCVYLEINQIFT